MKLINGKEISAAIRQELRADCAAFVQEHGYAPGLAVVIVGENPASQIYVRNKAKACEEVGFYSEIHRLPESTAEAELLALIDRLIDAGRGVILLLPEIALTPQSVAIFCSRYGQRVAVIDDLLATGGTALACAKLVEKAGGTVAACCFAIELEDLKGRETLKGYPVDTILVY